MRWCARIISVPCGGLSWRRDRLPKDDGELPAKSLGIESRADSGRRGYTASSQLSASSPSGPPRDDGRVRSCCSKPGHRRGVPSKRNGVGPSTHGEFTRLQRRDWLSLPFSPDWRSPLTGHPMAVNLDGEGITIMGRPKRLDSPEKITLCLSALCHKQMLELCRTLRGGAGAERR